MNVLIVDAAFSRAASALAARLRDGGDTVTRYRLDAADLKRKVDQGQPPKLLAELPPDTILLVNAHPAGGGHLADAWGLVWLEHMLAARADHLPAVLWSVDPHLAKRRLPYRASRLPDPGVNDYAVKLAPPSGPDEGNVVLWDPLSDTPLEDALTAAADTVAMGDEQRATVRNAPLVRALSRERHRLGNVASALRIIEGAWLSGWVSGNQLRSLRKAWRELDWPDRTGSIVENLLVRIGLLVKPHGGTEPCRAPEGELLLICDDHPFWETTLKLVWQGGDVEQVHDPRSLEDKLDELDKDSRTATVLLDLHFEDGPISAKTLATISEHPATSGLVLFTGDTTDGVLLREVYERGHTCFFKELSGPRDPSAYAARLAETLRAAVAYAPGDALLRYAATLWGGSEGVPDDIWRPLSEWRRHHYTLYLMFLLSTHVEQGIERWGGDELGIKADAKKGGLARQIMRDPGFIDEASLSTWGALGVAAKRLRNVLLHGFARRMVAETSQADRLLPDLSARLVLLLSAAWCLEERVAPATIPEPPKEATEALRHLVERHGLRWPSSSPEGESYPVWFQPVIGGNGVASGSFADTVIRAIVSLCGPAGRKSTGAGRTSKTTRTTATSAAPKRVAAPAPAPAASSAAAPSHEPSPLETAMAQKVGRSARSEAIKTLAKEGSIDDLIIVLSDCPNNTGKTQAAAALGKLGRSPRSVAALEAARAAGNDCLTAAADAALQKLGAGPPQP